MVISEAKKPRTSDPEAATETSAAKGGAFLTAPVTQEVFCRERFSEEQQDIDKMVREFAVDRIRPLLEELEAHDQELSRTLLGEVGELGLTGIDVPESYGGMRDGQDHLGAGRRGADSVRCRLLDRHLLRATPASARCRSSSSAPRSRRSGTCRSSPRPSGSAPTP